MQCEPQNKVFIVFVFVSLKNKGFCVFARRVFELYVTVVVLLQFNLNLNYRGAQMLKRSPHMG